MKTQLTAILVISFILIAGCATLSNTTKVSTPTQEKGGTDKNSCTDGTAFGKCSATKPMYCNSGNLVSRCKLCGCPEGQTCDEKYVSQDKNNEGQWGRCVTSQETPPASSSISDTGDVALNGKTPADGDSMNAYGWGVASGEAIYSSQKPYSGTLGFALSSSSGAVTGDTRVDKSATSGEFSIWIYDPLQPENLEEAFITLIGAQNKVVLSLGLFSASKANYNLILYTGSQYGYYNTGVQRSLGWHNFKINLNGEVYIDGTKSTTSFTPATITQVALQSRNCESTDPCYFDDFSFTFS
ncbi:hypothetical protein FJZ53_06280 [Candidatus Woesearchaeota archaeon]|nr:hypothetical protein [Candidatus Woesearchaeota archaeon]